ncbi:MAG: dihydrolipoyl dehydrogenase [Deltaproteobacteria bacterium]|nr:dihydrolipoyl dehydrogenase [Deltaproteobacteria bacterium]MCX7952552.1 dihydrolipoyl dehydrogenase [Deltaproteobacteria bacterium]
MENRDLVIIGGGPAGYTCAIRASQLGRKVTLIEKERLGGVCLNWGCIPTKSLLHHAKFVSEIQKAGALGVTISGYEINFEQIMLNSRSVANKLEQGVKYLMKKNNVEVIEGYARFENEGTIIVDSPGNKLSIKFNQLVLAIGASPKALPFVDVDGEVIHNYRTILLNKKLPSDLVVIGAGPIGLEFSYFFNSLGSRVTLIEVLDRIAPTEDLEVSKFLAKNFEENGINILTSAKVQNITKSSTGICVEVLTHENKPQKINADMVLLAVGVQPNTENIELEKVGILTSRGFISVNEKYQTTNPNVFAIGDCIGGVLLAHKASHEALILAEYLGNGHLTRLDREKIPSCIYTEPQVASIGLTEEQAKAKGYDIMVYRLPFSAVGKAVATFQTEGFCKVIVDSKYHEILGVHMIGPEVTELITSVSLAKTHEAVAESVLDTVFPHPTLSEAFLEAVAGAISRPINS